MSRAAGSLGHRPSTTRLGTRARRVALPWVCWPRSSAWQSCQDLSRQRQERITVDCGGRIRLPETRLACGMPLRTNERRPVPLSGASLARTERWPSTPTAERPGWLSRPQWLVPWMSQLGWSGPCLPPAVRRSTRCCFRGADAAPAPSCGYSGSRRPIHNAADRDSCADAGQRQIR
jgi:hypothetical protein